MICKKVSTCRRSLGRIKNFVPVATLHGNILYVISFPLWDTCSGGGGGGSSSSSSSSSSSRSERSSIIVSTRPSWKPGKCCFS